MDNVMSNKSVVLYKYCFVPSCTNTTSSTPNKIFISTPKIETLRKKWFKIARVDKPLSMKAPFYCCEDHFDIENDVENLTFYKFMMGKARIKLKAGVVPHKFDCQTTRLLTSKKSGGRCSVTKKLERKALVSHLLSSENCLTVENLTEDLPLRDKIPQVDEILGNLERVKNLEEVIKEEPTTSKDDEIAPHVLKIDRCVQVKPNCQDVGVMVNIKPYFRSKYTKVGSEHRDSATSPLKRKSNSIIETKTKKLKLDAEMESDISIISAGGSSYEVSNSSSIEVSHQPIAKLIETH